MAKRIPWVGASFSWERPSRRRTALGIARNGNERAETIGLENKRVHRKWIKKTNPPRMSIDIFGAGTTE
jgi:hypothetical protein